MRVLRPWVLFLLLIFSHAVVPDEVHDVVIVGAGLTGLSLAFHLKLLNPHLKLLLVDQNPKIGGLVNTQSNQNGFLWEEGPNSFQPDPITIDIFRKIDIINQLTCADPKLPRFLLDKNKIHKIPLSITDFILNFKPISFWDKAKTLANAALGRRAKIQKPTNETLADAIDRIASPAVRKKLLQPMVSGIFAGDAKRLSAANVFSTVLLEDAVSFSLMRGLANKPANTLLRPIHSFADPAVLETQVHSVYEAEGLERRVKKLPLDRHPFIESADDERKSLSNSLCSFKWGMETMVTALAGYADISEARRSLVLNTRVSRIEKKQASISKDNYYWYIHADKSNNNNNNDGGSGTAMFVSRSVVFTGASYATASVVGGLDGIGGRLGDLLGSIEHPTVAAVVLAVKQDALDRTKACVVETEGGGCGLSGFGLLVGDDDDVDGYMGKFGVPRGNPVIGVIFASSLFRENRAPPGYEVLVVFLGGSRNAGFNLGGQNEEALLGYVRDFFSEGSILRDGVVFDSSMVDVLGVRRWARSIPQPGMGYSALVSGVAELEDSLNNGKDASRGGLFLFGSWRDGIAVGDCLKSGIMRSVQVYDYLRRMQEFVI